MSIKNFKKIIKLIDKDILVKIIKISGINEESSKIIKMTFVDGLPNKDICSIMAISKSTYTNIINENIARMETCLYTVIKAMCLKD